jgi:hypothetical protein
MIINKAIEIRYLEYETASQFESIVAAYTFMAAISSDKCGTQAENEENT